MCNNSVSISHCYCYCNSCYNVHVDEKKNESTPQDNINKVLYEEVTSPSHTSKNDVELQQNPAYGTGRKVVMDTNPAYESYK